MALATSTIVALAAAAAAAGTSAYNTNQTAKKQDRALAGSIRNQDKKQQEIDARINKEVQELSQSNSADERAESLANYTDTVRKGSGDITAGLTPGIGSDAFKADAAKGAQGTLDYAGNIAGLMSRIDAPSMQRRGEAFGYGRLATDNNMIAREARGQAFLDELRLRSIQRNPWLDAAAATMSSYGGNFSGAPTSATGSSIGGGIGSATAGIGG